MAFADPQSLTIGADTFTLPRVGSAPNQGRYRYTDTATGNTYQVTIEHPTSKSRSRHSIRLDVTQPMPDPFNPALNRLASYSTYLVVNTIDGLVPLDYIKSVVLGLTGLLTASSGAAIDKLNGGQV